MANKQIAVVQGICAKAKEEYECSGNFIVKLSQVTRIVASVEVRLERNLISLTSLVVECLDVAEELLCGLRKEAENMEELVWIDGIEARIGNIYE